jgi:type IV pilus assembly protein PilW
MHFCGQLMRGHRGFSLIEMMIALALGVVIMLGVTQVATDNSEIRWELSRTARQIENATFALREIESDLMSAGYWGEIGLQEPGLNLPPVCPNEIDAITPQNDEMLQMITIPVQGGTIPDSDGSEEFACSTVTVDGASEDAIMPLLGSDFISVRRASSCALGEDGCGAADGDFYLQSEACFREGVDDFDLPGEAKVIAPISEDPDLNTVFKYQRRDCDNTPSLDARAPIYRLINRIYYLQRYGDDEEKKGELMRADLVADRYVQTPVVEGVEMLRFEYGMDRDGDAQVDEGVDGYTLEPTTKFFEVEDEGGEKNAFSRGWGDVVMVRIYMLVRNLDPSPGYKDTRVYTIAGTEFTVPEELQNYRRQLYVRTVSLRNLELQRDWKAEEAL